MRTYSGVVRGRGVSVCAHLHESIAEALGCADKSARRAPVVRGTDVVGAEMGADGIPRYRNLSPSERVELAGLRGDPVKIEIPK